MKFDVLVAEIGSTTTVVNAFNKLDSDNPVFAGQGFALTSVLDGDVTIGLNNAIDDLRKKISADSIEYDKMLATSSAAGGLKMTVHGLVYDMTARAAKEAALGAGAIVHFVTAGKLTRFDLIKTIEIGPNIMLLAGGVDYGEKETAVYNAEKIASLDFDIPVIYAGNIENREEIKEIFAEKNKSRLLAIVDNVYPKIDLLNVEPCRKVIQDVFEEHIIHAPGMTKVRELVNGAIIPTPGAVMAAAKILREDIGDLVVIDVGGATTDVHSVTEGSEEISKILLNPEPRAKRTVEGDLGVYINLPNIIELCGKDKLAEELKLNIDAMVGNRKYIPESDDEIRFVERLAGEAVVISINRHAGNYRRIYGASGAKTIAEGKDLTNIKYIIGTGGALTRLPHNIDLIKSIFKNNKGDKLLPQKETGILIDNNYIMASLGVLSREYPAAAIKLLKNSLHLPIA